ncbi:MAG: energy-coupling factor transporter transmembrane protein EcfT [Clostridiaceae bacterium]|nr:energy-coupling factor transporter transmembrane protein EcfT [Clostridiaceae bacterium]
MKLFYDYHPKVRLIYFSTILIISMLTINPIWVSLTFIFSSIALIDLYDFKFYLKRLFSMLPILILLILMNTIFNSRGLTVLFHLVEGKPITLEALLYSFFSGLALISILLWFHTWNNFIKSDEILEIFGQKLPTIGLMLSMILKYIPDTVKEANAITLNQKALLGEEKLKKQDRIKLSISLFSILLSVSMENALQTADSMQSKGYPSENRKTYVKNQFNSKDRFLSIIFVSLFLLHIITLIFGGSKFAYYPFIIWQNFEQNFYISILSVMSFSFILVFPYILNIIDRLKWKKILEKEKINSKQIKSGLIIYE